MTHAGCKVRKIGSASIASSYKRLRPTSQTCGKLLQAEEFFVELQEKGEDLVLELRKVGAKSG